MPSKTFEQLTRMAKKAATTKDSYFEEFFEFLIQNSKDPKTSGISEVAMHAARVWCSACWSEGYKRGWNDGANCATDEHQEVLGEIQREELRKAGF